MIVDNFNRSLQRYSHVLAYLRVLRATLSSVPMETLLTYLAGLDQEEKGYFAPQEVQRIWLSQPEADQASIQRLMGAAFPFDKISYTALLHFLAPDHQTPPIPLQQNNLGVLVQQIFDNQLQATELEAVVVGKLENFVPMKYSRPSEEELSRYVICQELVVDVREVARRLNLLESSGEAQGRRAELEFEKTLANPSVSGLQDIMKRLQAKVNSFGGEWLREGDHWQQNA